MCMLLIEVSKALSKITYLLQIPPEEKYLEYKFLTIWSTSSYKIFGISPRMKFHILTWCFDFLQEHLSYKLCCLC